MITYLRKNKFISSELIAVLAACVWGILGAFLLPNFSDSETIITISFVVMIVLLFLFRNPHPRHFWIAFSLVILTALVNLTDLERATYFLSSFVVLMLLLGIMNLLFFNPISKNPLSESAAVASKKSSIKRKKH